MADEPTQDPALTQDSPDQSASQDGTRASAVETPTPQDDQQVDWEKRYKDTQAAYTEQQQAIAQYEAVVEAAQEGDPQALELLGLELDETDDSPDEEDAEPYLTREEWQQYMAAQQGMYEEAQQEALEEQAQEQVIDYVEHGLQQIEGQLGRELTEDEVNFLAPRALAVADEQGYPDVQGAWQAMEQLTEAQVKEYIQGKRSAARAPSGQSADEKPPDLTTREGRVEFGVQRLRELEDAQTLT